MKKRFSRALCALLVITMARPAFADSKADARRYFQRGMALIDQGKFSAGITQLEKAYEIRPHPNVLFNIGQAYASAGKLRDAVRYFERYLSFDPPDAAKVRGVIRDLKQRIALRRMVARAMRAIDGGRPLDGAALLQRAYEQRPHPAILFNLGRAYEEAGSTQRAITAFERYLATEPRDADEVRARVEALRAALARERGAASTPSSVQLAPVPSTPPRTGRRSSAARTPAPLEVPTPSTVPAPPRELSEAELDRLADRLADALAARLPPPAPPPSTATSIESETGEPAVPELEGQSVTAAAEELESKTGEVYEDVVITASRRAESPLDAPNAVTILTAEDIRLSGARALPDLLRRVPGVDVMAMSYSDFNVAVRGFNRRVANKILVLIDGRTAYQDFLGLTLWRGFSIDLRDIDRVEVVRGPGSAIYGAYAYTGIINIITKSPNEIRGGTVYAAAGNGERVEAAFQFGDVKGPIGFRISGGYERADKFDNEFDVEDADVSSNLSDLDESREIARADGQAEYTVGSGKFYAGAGARVGFSEVYGVSSLRNQAVDGIVSNVRAGYTDEQLSFRAYWQSQSVRTEPQFFPTGTNNLSGNIESDVVSIEPLYRPTFELGGTHRLIIGAEYRFKYIDWNYLNDVQTENHFALFFQDAYSPSDKFSIIASARLDIHPFIGPLASPRVAFIFKPTPQQAFRLTAGTAFRVPTLAESYIALEALTPNPGAAIRLVGGRVDGNDIDEERIASIDLGYRFINDFIDVEAVAFFNRVTNLIVQTPLESTGPVSIVDPTLDAFVLAESTYVNSEQDFIALGSELALRLYPVDGLDLGLTYSLQYIFDEETGDRFTDSPVHKGTLWGQYRLPAGLDLGLSASYTSSQRWVEPRFDPDDPSGFDSTPLPVDGSVVMLGRVGYRFFDGDLELGVTGTNLLDVGDNREREHPFANRREIRVAGELIGRF
ncbi:MAG: TonB-dependent receptor [Myxococcota bacterium]